MRHAYAPLVAALLISACADSPMPHLSPGDVPARFQEPSNKAAPLWPSSTWWRGFGDAQLSSLIAQARASNLDLYQAAARVRQADAYVRQAGAALLPSVGLGTSIIAYGGEAHGITANETDYSTALNVSYDLDFWGKNRDRLLSARATRAASVADRATVALAVTAGVATTYFQILALQERIQLARASLTSSRAILKIVQRRVNAGYAAPADLIQERTQLAAQQAALPVLEQQELEAHSALAILVGVPPESLHLKPARLANLTIPTVQPGLPSELLTRRPDIAGAEASLSAAHADLALARKAFLPDITLTAGGGAAYPALAAAVRTLSGFGPSAAGAASLTQAIFAGGAIRGRIEESRARQDELLGAYRAAVLASFADVENALGSVAHLSARQAALKAQADESAQLLDAARRQYTAGYADFLTVIDAQRSLYSARDQLADVRRARLTALVMLFKALGGGWRLPMQGAAGQR